MDRDLVVERLTTALAGRDLASLARAYGVTVPRNKGWVGQTIERAAALDGGSRAAPDGGDFELKTTTLLRDDAGGWKPKETIKVTMLNPTAILDDTFESSLLWRKLAQLVVVGCVHEDDGSCRVVRVRSFAMEDQELVTGIRDFWSEVRAVIASGDFPDVFGSIGTSENWLQLRGSGTGKEDSVCPITGRRFPAQAFYATKPLVRRMLAL